VEGESQNEENMKKAPFLLLSGNITLKADCFSSIQIIHESITIAKRFKLAQKNDF